VAPVLAEYRELRTIEPPGTLEGGDVLTVGRAIFVGLSSRTNAEGVEQLRSVAEAFGYSVRPVPVTECLHLKSAVSQVGPEAVLINPRWVDASVFKGLRVLTVDPTERYAANGLLVGGSLIYPQSFPRTAEVLARHGAPLETLELSELQKAEGAVTCCSLVFHGGIGD
jgi:dimethylargininase